LLTGNSWQGCGKMRGKQTIAIIWILSTLCAILPFSMISISEATGNQEVQDALTLFQTYIDSFYKQINSTHAVAIDHKGLPLRVLCPNGKWAIVGKRTNDGGWDTGQAGTENIAGGYDFKVLKHDMSDYGIEHGDQYQYAFDLSGDGKPWDHCVLNITYAAYNSTYMYLEVKVHSIDTANCDLYLDTERIITGMTAGNEVSRVKQYGWVTPVYVNRHTTKLLAEYYGLVRNDLDKRDKLRTSFHRQANASYQTGQAGSIPWDFFDPLFTCSKLIPDYPLCDRTPEGNTNYAWLTTNYTYYDWMYWQNNPFYLTNDTYAIPYRSRISNELLAHGWCYGNEISAFVDIAFMQFTPTGDYYPIVKQQGTHWGHSWMAKLMWAIHLMDKYGNTGDYIKQAKQYIDEVIWDGFGIRQEIFNQWKAWWVGGDLRTQLLAVYTVALARYYLLTGNEFYGQRADICARLLLSLQVKQDSWVDFGNMKQRRPDMIGGFYGMYRIGNSFDAVYDTGTGALTNWYVNNLKGGHIDPTSTAEIVIDHTETDIAAAVALWWYNQTGRTPYSIIPEIHFSSEANVFNYSIIVDGDGKYAYDPLTNDPKTKFGIVTDAFQQERCSILYAWNGTIDRDITDPETMSVIGFDASFSFPAFCYNNMSIIHRIYNGSSVDPDDLLSEKLIQLYYDYDGDVNTLNVTYATHSGLTLHANHTYTLQLEIFTQVFGAFQGSQSKIAMGYEIFDYLHVRTKKFLKIWTFGFTRYNSTETSSTVYAVNLNSNPNNAIPYFRKTGTSTWYSLGQQFNAIQNTVLTNCTVWLGNGTFDFMFAKTGYDSRIITAQDITQNNTSINVKLAHSHYMRSDSWTVNGLNAHKLDASNTANQDSIAAIDEGSKTVYTTVYAYIRHSGGSKTTIGSVSCSRNSGSGTLLITRTLNVSNTNLQITDAIEIDITVNVGIDSETAYFITQQLGVSKLDAETWTFYLYIYRCYDKIEDYTTGAVAWGSDSFPSRIEQMLY